MKKQEKKEEYYTIDIMHVLRTIAKRFWVVVVLGLLAATVCFLVSAFVLVPKYSSYVKLYVNNSSFSLGNTSFSISSSELTAAQSLVKTYGEILVSRSTLERVKEKSGVDYPWDELSEMIEYSSSNNTEIMKVTVTCEDPYVASDIANTIAEVLPVRISEIIEGASMEVVDTAIPDLQKVEPSVTKYTAIGLTLGVLLALVILVVHALLDDTIYNEEYILNNYDYPILGKVPDLLETSNKAYRYYKKSNN